jgi:Tol biopolymer transport system component
MAMTEPIGVTTSGAIFYTTGTGRPGGSIELGRFDSTSGAITAARDISPNPAENNVNPCWSNGGQYLAYVSVRGGSSELPVIVLRSNTGGLVRELRPRLLGTQLAAWGDNDRAVLVTGRDAGGRYGAFRVDIETGEASLVYAVPNAPTAQLPEWSPDGQTLYYLRRNSAGSEQTFIARNLTSGNERELVRRPTLGGLQLSWDGRYLATSVGGAVVLVPTDGTAPREFRPPAESTAVEPGGKPPNFGAASWAPDSRSIIARLARADGPSELWRVSIDGGPPQKMQFALEAQALAFRISPDGAHVAYRLRNTEPPLPRQVWKFEHFLPGTK